MNNTKRLISLAILAGNLLAPRADADEQSFLKPPQYVGPPQALHAVANRAFQGIPSIAVSPGGRLWVTWYAGITPGEDHNNYAVLSTSSDQGATWQEMLVADPDAGGPVRAFDPELWMAPDAKLRWVWAQAIEHSGSVAGVWMLEISNPDSGDPQWTAPRRITDGIMMCKPIVLSTGEWVLPVSTWRETDHSARMVVSTDQGKTWSVRGACHVPVADRNYDEHMFVERKDGSLWLLVRTKYGIGESVSTDRGRTWSELTPSSIPHPAARFFITRLNSGNLLLAKHGSMNERTGRSHLTAFVSKDDGKNWGDGLLLDDRLGVSYPDGQQTPDGLIRIIYDYNRTRERHILMATFREEDAAAGKDSSGAVRLRRLVSEAFGGKEGPKAETKPRNANADGQPLRAGPSAELEFSDGQADVLAPGVKLFLDRTYPALEVPAALRGKPFVRFNITGGRVVCRRAGTVYLLTPSAGRQRDSLAEVLLKRGFEKVNLPEFMLFTGEGNVCTVFQKQLVKGETLEFAKWAVLVLPGADAKLSRVASAELAADPAPLQLWDRQVPFPESDAMLDLPLVTHVQLERAEPDGYHYLHESAIAWHKGTLYAGWANHRQLEVNVKDELLRGRTSTDGGFTWSAVSTWAAAPLLGGESFNHPVLMSHQHKLWGFFTRWENELPRTEIFTLNETTQTWRPVQKHIPGFVPFSPPRRLSDGNWIMGGELHWYEAAVAISHGDDFTRWDMVQIPRPEDITLLYPETTLFEQGDAWVALCRPRNARTAPASVSPDQGRTWTPLRPSNFPLGTSKPLCGKLSTGQQYLIANNLEQGRTLLSIAVTAPGGQLFSRIWKIRHQQTPKRRLLGSLTNKSSVGKPTEWSYPAAIEHDGKLYVTYTQGKEDCALSIIPVSALAVR